MAIFNSNQDFAISTIEENLKIADYCIRNPKEDKTDCCYGMPALILLSSAIDIIGTFYYSNAFTTDLGSTIKHFEEFYDRFMEGKAGQQPNICDRGLFIDKFYKLGRCKATHNGVLGAKFIITTNNNASNTCIWEDHDSVWVQLHQLHNLIDSAFQTMKSNLGTTSQVEQLLDNTGFTSCNISVTK